jgi:hypothetical protein
MGKSHLQVQVLMSCAFLVHMLCMERYSFELCSCILFSCMFKIFHVELVHRAVVNGHQNKQIVMFER